MPQKSGFCKAGGVVDAPPRGGRTPTSAFSGLRERNRPSTLQLRPVYEQHVMMDDKFDI